MIVGSGTVMRWRLLVSVRVAISGVFVMTAVTACGEASKGATPTSSASSTTSSPVSTVTPTTTVVSTPPAPGFRSSATPLSCGPGGAGSASATGTTVDALTGVQFVSSRQGWVVGSGRILATLNGGHTWYVQYRGPAQLYQVDFVDAEHGWAVGIDRLLGTVDGGRHWVSLAEQCRRIRSVHFASPTVGYAVAGGGQLPDIPDISSASTPSQLMVTSNGGRDWKPMSAAPGRAQSVCFTSPKGGWLGTPGRIWRTVDGGDHWVLSLAEPPPVAGMADQIDVPVIECSGSEAAWVLFIGSGAATSHAPYLGYATQDGSRWHLVMEEGYIEQAARPQLHAPEGPGSYPGPFSVIGDDTAAFVGYLPPIGYGAAPLDIATAGGSQLASKGYVAGITRPSGTAFLTPEEGWVVGIDQTATSSDFVIEGTSDGGATWTRQYRTAA